MWGVPSQRLHEPKAAAYFGVEYIPAPHPLCPNSSVGFPPLIYHNLSAIRDTAI